MLYPDRIRKKLLRISFIGAVAALAFAPRLVLLLTVEKRLDADESVVGLMAKHITEMKGVPLFFYGQHYGGGHVIEAMFASLCFFIAGPSSFAVQLAPALFSVALVMLVFFFTEKLYGSRTAFWAAMLLSVSTPFLKSSVKADGYIETIFLYTLAFYFLHLLQSALFGKEGKPRKDMDEWGALKYSVALGACLGAAWWSYDFSLIATFSAAVFILAKRAVRSVSHGVILLVSFAAGASPVIYDNVAHNYANLKHLFGGAPVSGDLFFKHAAESAVKLFTVQLPAFFSRDCVHFFVYPPPIESWVYYGLLAFCVFALLMTRKRSKLPGLFFLFPILYLAFYCASGFSGVSKSQLIPQLDISAYKYGMSPRYLLPLEPFISIYMAVAIGTLAGSKRVLARFIGALCVAALIPALFLGFYSIMQDNTIVEGNVKTNPESIPKVVAFLKSKDLTCVDTTYFVKWRILFESRETINAMDMEITSGRKNSEFNDYELLGCPKNKPPAYVFNASSPYIFAAREIINTGPYQYLKWRNSDHIVIFSEGKKKK